MKEAPLYSSNGTPSKKSLTLDPKIFDLEVNSHDLLKTAYLSHASRIRNAHPKTLDRGEVRGGGRKPWRQKGTGRARHGSSRSPIWRGGGVTFGPVSSHNVQRSVSRQTRKTAIRQALSLKFKADSIYVIDKIAVEEPSSSKAASLLLNILGAVRKGLIVSQEPSENLILSLRNLPNIKLVSSRYLNAYDLLNADKILIESKALIELSELLVRKRKAGKDE